MRVGPLLVVCFVRSSPIVSLCVEFSLSAHGVRECFAFAVPFRVGAHFYEMVSLHFY